MTDSIEKLLKKLNKLIAKTESPADTAEWVIADIALNNSENFYEMIGILQEALLRMREIYREGMEDEKEKPPEEDLPDITPENDIIKDSKIPNGIAGDRLRYIG